MTRLLGRRHSLQSVLLLAVGAVLAGVRSYAAIAQWARCAGQAVVVCGKTPHATTLGRVLAAVDGGALQAALTGCVLGRQARSRQRAEVTRPRGEGRTALAVDGKTLRDVVITADALHCQRAHAKNLRVRGAHYLFTVKAVHRQG